MNLQTYYSFLKIDYNNNATLFQAKTNRNTLKSINIINKNIESQISINILTQMANFIYLFFLCLSFISYYQQKVGRMSQSMQLFRGFICGSFSGCAQVFVMQPFEMIKVRLVNQSLIKPQYSGIKDCFKKILRQEGVRSFYKGTLSPLLGYGIQGALVFGSNEIFKKLIKYINQDEIHPGNTLPMSSILLSGVLTGMVSSLVITPADHTRIMMQKQTKNIHKSSIKAGRYMYKNYGLKGLYLGFNPTFIRQIKANAVYFYSYEYIMRLFAPQGHGSGSAPIMISFFAGGISGSASWLLSYPVDYIKTKIQSQNLAALQYRNSIHCAKKMYKTEGIKTFFKGLGITLLRSFPVNGVAFFSYQYIMRRMGWKKQ